MISVLAVHTTTRLSFSRGSFGSYPYTTSKTLSARVRRMHNGVWMTPSSSRWASLSQGGRYWGYYTINHSTGQDRRCTLEHFSQ
jgi:hypothetical protein